MCMNEESAHHFTTWIILQEGCGIAVVTQIQSLSVRLDMVDIDI